MTGAFVTRAPRRSRRLERASLPNVRDLGGLSVRGGGVTRFDRVLRCGNLARSSAADVDWLVDRVGLRLAIDLRSESESARDGDARALAARGVRCEAVPIATTRHYLAGQPLP